MKLVAPPEKLTLAFHAPATHSQLSNRGPMYFTWILSSNLSTCNFMFHISHWFHYIWFFPNVNPDFYAPDGLHELETGHNDGGSWLYSCCTKCCMKMALLVSYWVLLSHLCITCQHTPIKGMCVKGYSGQLWLCLLMSKLPSINLLNCCMFFSFMNAPASSLPRQVAQT